jgi:hypothetical protein
MCVYGVAKLERAATEGNEITAKFIGVKDGVVELEEADGTKYQIDIFGLNAKSQKLALDSMRLARTKAGQ